MKIEFKNKANDLRDDQLLISTDKLNEIQIKYKLLETDITHLRAQLGIIVLHENKKEISSSAEEAYRDINKVIKSLTKIQRIDKRLSDTYLPSFQELLAEQLNNIDHLIAKLGMLTINKDLETTYKRNGNSQEVINRAKYKERIVGSSFGSALIRTRKVVSKKQQYVDELFTLALFWISRKGIIPKTRPSSVKSEIHDSFFDFCSEIMGVKSLTPDAIFEKFWTNYKVEFLDKYTLRENNI